MLFWTHQRLTLKSAVSLQALMVDGESLPNGGAVEEPTTQLELDWGPEKPSGADGHTLSSFMALERSTTQLASEGRRTPPPREDELLRLIALQRALVGSPCCSICGTPTSPVTSPTRVIHGVRGQGGGRRASHKHDRRVGRSLFDRHPPVVKRGWNTLTILATVVFLWHGSRPLEDQRAWVICLEFAWFVSDLVLSWQDYTRTTWQGPHHKPRGWVSLGWVRIRVSRKLERRLPIIFALCIVALMLPWVGLFGVVLGSAPKPKREVLGRVGRWMKQLRGKTVHLKGWMGSRCPRALKPSNIRRFLEITHILEVRRIDGVKHVIKHKKTYRCLADWVKTLKWAFQFPRVSFVTRVLCKLKSYMVQDERPVEPLQTHHLEALMQTRPCTPSPVSTPPNGFVYDRERSWVPIGDKDD